MQKIIINHLGPVQKFEMDIKDFNLLIGEQTTGKSTIAKCIYFFRMIKTTVTDYLCQICDTALYNGKEIDSGFNTVLKSELKSIFISLFGFSWDLDERLYLKYEFAHNIWIDLILNKNHNKTFISVRYSNELKSKINELELQAKQLYMQKKDISTSLAYASKERIRNYDNMKISVNEIFNDDKETYYIPAGRSMITLLVNNRSLLENENLDLITRQFMQIIESIHASFSDGIRNVHKRFPDSERKFDTSILSEKLVSNLKGDYRYSPGKEYIIIEDGLNTNDKIPINFASSGQQELLWLLNQLYILILKKEKSFVIIEEPEAHLYPTLQKDVMDFISFFVNINNSSVLITTHSPYILTVSNAYYCAGKLLKENDSIAKQVYGIIGNKRSIDPDQLSAYKLSKNNKISNLVDENLQELATDLIDDVSDKINRMYIDLLYLQENN